MKIKQINFSSLKNFDNHLVISYFSDEKTGLNGFICLHNLNLGPALGGTRYWAYRSIQEALEDCLKLSRAMTYKCALAGIKAGGGKGVIIKTPKTEKNIFKVLERYAQVVNSFNGNFYTGEDVGMIPKYVEFLAKKSKFIIGSEKKSGSPSPFAALGVFYAIKAALKFVYGNENLKNRSVAIKGLGKVGSELARLILKEGGDVIGSDINEKTLKKIKKTLPQIKLVSTEEIHKLEADIFSPCSVGGEINEKNFKEIKAKIICGSSNNQLTKENLGYELFKKGILYIPDYIANAGGLINVADELNPNGYSRTRVLKNIHNIYYTTLRILKLSQKLKKPPNIVSNILAESIFNKSKTKEMLLKMFFK